jgi:hypothetical protein
MTNNVEMGFLRAMGKATERVDRILDVRTGLEQEI